MTVSCCDTAPIPKVPGAGGVFSNSEGVAIQRMHNGINVLAGAYHGEWMSEVIRRLGGHHEPQEELLFHAALPLIKSDNSAPVMVELGSFWGYYSLWFKAAFPHARNILIEPDPTSLKVGEKNFQLNGFHAEFLQAAVGVHNAETEFLCESDGITRSVRTISVDGLVQDLSLQCIHMLHVDIQGAELSMLDGAAETMRSRNVHWLFLSTHHHSISGDPLTHQRCLQWLQTHGALIIDEHSVSESFSGDGLIVASFGKKPLALPRISRNVPSRSLFRETEYDLAEAWEEIRRLSTE